jgi:MYXO-CTERM domain-containing protein
MRGGIIAVAVTLALLLPAAARAALILNVEQKEVAPSSQDQVVLLDVWLDDPERVEQFLSGYTLVMHGPSNAENGVRFLTAGELGAAHFPFSSQAHPYMFDFPTSPRVPSDAGTTYDRLLVVARRESPHFADVTPELNGLLAIPVLVPVGTSPGIYDFLVDPSITATRLLPASDPYVLGQSGRITVTPDPAAFAPLVIASLLLLRRRRRPRRN